VKVFVKDLSAIPVTFPILCLDIQSRSDSICAARKKERIRMKDRIKKILSPSPLTISLAIIVAAAAVYILDPPFFRFMELKTLDLRILSRGERAPGGETVIAVVDEKSVKELGRWPWPRTVIAGLVEVLKSCGAKAVGFDIVFAEPDQNSSLRDIRELTKEVQASGIKDAKISGLLRRKLMEADTDAALAQAIKNAGNVTLGYFFHRSNKDVSHLTEKDIEAGRELIAPFKYPMIQAQGEPDESVLVRAYAAEANIREISLAADNAGCFNAFPDSDGSIRWAPLAIKFKGDFYPPLSLALISQYLDYPMLVLHLAEFGVAGVQVGDFAIPTDESGRILINYLGRAKTFPHYSITDILHGRLQPDLFKDKIVIVGATATGIYDLRVTPFSSVFPGVEIHANVIDNILHRNFIQRPGWAGLFDLAAILVLGLAIGLAAPRVRAVTGIFLALALLAAYVLLNGFIFTRFNFWLNLVYPVGTVMTVYLAITLYKYVTEEREKKKIRGAFQYYLTASVINEMLKDPSKLKLGGDKKRLSVLFSDIRGFTTVSESLTPEDLVHLLNEYLTAMTDIVFKYDGLLDKYMGDAIMAVYGAPLDQPDHAERACRTALDMMEKLHELQKKWSGEGRPVLNIGVGVNSGDMVVGNMGSQMRFDYTVMGDSVNLGSRLEGINKEYGTNIVISEFTYEEVKEKLVCRELDSVRVKGKHLPVKIYELLGDRKDAEKWEPLIRAFDAALTSYKEGRWDEAIAGFRKVQEVRPGDPPAGLYIGRCEVLKAHPPEGVWDGVFTMTKK